MALSQEQIDSFRRDGFVVYGELLDNAEITRLREEYDRIFADAGITGQMRNLSASDDADDRPPQQMLQIMQMCERSLIFRRLLYDARILDIVTDLIGPNIMLFHDQALYKPARSGGPIHWHQDNAYWRCAPANLVSCWLTLDDVCRENGAMQLIPGSHLLPVLHSRADEQSPLLLTEADPAAAQVVALPAGGCMFHHCQTLHHTAPNTTDRQRRAFAMHFMPPGTRDGGGEIMHASFTHPVLRMQV